MNTYIISVPSLEEIELETERDFTRSHLHDDSETAWMYDSD